MIEARRKAGALGDPLGRSRESGGRGPVTSLPRRGLKSCPNTLGAEVLLRLGADRVRGGQADAGRVRQPAGLGMLRVPTAVLRRRERPSAAMVAAPHGPRPGQARF